MIAPLALLLWAATGSNQFTPTFPGAIVAWIVRHTRKKYEFGGWLLFFYWQLSPVSVRQAVGGVEHYYREAQEEGREPARRGGVRRGGVVIAAGAGPAGLK